VAAARRVRGDAVGRGTRRGLAGAAPGYAPATNREVAYMLTILLIIIVILLLAGGGWGFGRRRRV
jgi:LPXTG-motif cell wall-anchored protein